MPDRPKPRRFRPNSTAVRAVDAGRANPFAFALESARLATK